MTLDASASFADRCVDGFVEYRWRLGGSTVKDYSTDPFLVDTPALTTVYTVDVRCSTDPECLGSDSVTVLPADELEVSGIPGALGEILPGSSPAVPDGSGGILSPALARWVEPGVGGPHSVSVVALNLARNGVTLRAAAGQTAAPSVLAAAVRDDLCLLGAAVDAGDGAVELEEATISLATDEAVGYLAVATSAQGIVGTLGRGEPIGPPAAFGRGRRTPGSLPACGP